MQRQDKRILTRQGFEGCGLTFVGVCRVAEVDFVKESRALVDLIQKMERGEPIYQAGQQQQAGYGAAAAAAPRVRLSHSAL